MVFYINLMVLVKALFFINLIFSADNFKIFAEVRFQTKTIKKKRKFYNFNFTQSFTLTF